MPTRRSRQNRNTTSTADPPATAQDNGSNVYLLHLCEKVESILHEQTQIKRILLQCIVQLHKDSNKDTSRDCPPEVVSQGTANGGLQGDQERSKETGSESTDTFYKSTVLKPERLADENPTHIEDTSQMGGICSRTMETPEEELVAEPAAKAEPPLVTTKLVSMPTAEPTMASTGGEEERKVIIAKPKTTKTSKASAAAKAAQKKHPVCASPPLIQEASRA